MKHLLSVFLLLIGLSGKAQFFQSIYGGAGGEHLTSGHNVVVQPQFGHLMSGDYNNPAVGPRLMVVRTDAAGLFPAAPFFSNLYQLNDPAGNILTTGQNKIIELNSGAGYAVCGVSTSIAGVNYVYLLMLNPAGGVVAAYDYLPPAPYVISNIHTAIAQNAAGTAVYITGHASNGADDDYYVMKIAAATGNVIWSGMYNMGGTFDYSSELIESPFAAEVVVVGGRSGASWGIMDAFITRLNANNGAHLATYVYGAAANHDYFRSIRVSNNPAPAAGYIVGGASNSRTGGAGGNMDMWTVKFNAAIAMLITTVHDHPVNINSNQVCLDVIERLNTAGVYEYYAVGSLTPGVFGGNLDIQVCKLGPGLIGVPGGTFNYGGVGAEEGFNIDINNGAMATGLSVYGKTAGSFAAGGLSDFYLIKSYFNGISGCNEMFFGPASVNQPFALVMPLVNKNSNLVKRVIAPVAVAGPPQAYLCFAMAVAGGNNARVAPVEQKETLAEFDMDIYPNPGTSTEIPRIRIKSQLGAEGHVSIYDLMGRKCYESAVGLYPGYTNFSLEEAMKTMAKGMYTVQVSDGNQTKAQRLMIQ